MDARKAVITGVAPLSAVGIGREAFWEALVSGQSGIGDVSLFDVSGLRSRKAADVKDFRLEDFISSEKTYLDRCSAFTLAACAILLHDANTQTPKHPNTQTPMNHDRLGICLGTAYGCQDSMMLFWERVAQRGAKFASSLVFTHTFINSPISLAAIEFNLKGFHCTYSAGLVSGLQAIAHAALAIQTGKADAILAGGVEALSRLSFLAHHEAGNLSPQREGGEGMSRPFDAEADGFVLGEGCGLVMVEESEHARARSAAVLAEVTGIGLATEPKNLSKALQRSMAVALQTASGELKEVDVIFAAANSHPHLDRAEAEAIEALFGIHQPLVTSIKGALGEGVGAGSGLSAVAAALAEQTGSVPPTLNLQKPIRDLNFVRGQPQEAMPQVALVNALDPKGAAISVLLRRTQP